MLLDLHLVAQRPLFVLGVAAGVILAKAVIITLIDRSFGRRWMNSIRLGLLLSQAGEFGFVLFAQATAAQLITPAAASLFGAIVTLSMATTPFLMGRPCSVDRGAPFRGASPLLQLPGG